MPFHTVIPLLTSDETLGLGEVVSDRKMLFRHSRALIWTELSAEVVGGCTEGDASGGKDKAVGWMRAINGATRLVKNDGLELVGAVGSSDMLTSASAETSISNSTPGRKNVSHEMHGEDDAQSYPRPLPHCYPPRWQGGLVQDLAKLHMYP